MLRLKEEQEGAERGCPAPGVPALLTLQGVQGVICASVTLVDLPGWALLPFHPFPVLSRTELKALPVH